MLWVYLFKYSLILSIQKPKKKLDLLIDAIYTALIWKISENVNFVLTLYFQKDFSLNFGARPDHSEIKKN